MSTSPFDALKDLVEKGCSGMSKEGRKWAAIRENMKVAKGDDGQLATSEPPAGEMTGYGDENDSPQVRRGIKHEVEEHGIDEGLARKLVNDHLAKDPTYYDHEEQDEGESEYGDDAGAHAMTDLKNRLAKVRAKDGTPEHEKAESPEQEASEHATGHEPNDEDIEGEPDDDKTGGPLDAEASQQKLIDWFRAWNAARKTGTLPEGTPDFVKPQPGENAGQFSVRLAEATEHMPEFALDVEDVGPGAEWVDHVAGIGQYMALIGSPDREVAKSLEVEPVTPFTSLADRYNVAKGMMPEGCGSHGGPNLTSEEAKAVTERRLRAYAEEWAKGKMEMKAGPDSYCCGLPIEEARAESIADFVKRVGDQEVRALDWDTSRIRIMRACGGVDKFEKWVKKIVKAAVSKVATDRAIRSVVEIDG